jgi:hypothetical protein
MNRTNHNTVNKVSKFVTLFALPLSHLPGFKYQGIKPDRTTTHLETLYTGTNNESLRNPLPRHGSSSQTLCLDGKKRAVASSPPGLPHG